jgi:hypothetical protein
MNISICIPSYKRPFVETLKYIPSARVYVAKSQFDEYKKRNPNSNIISVEEKYQGNVCRIRNRIMDLEKDNILCIVDDALQYIGYWENKKDIKLDTEKEIYLFIEKYTIMAQDIGAKLWGINVNKDKQVYTEHRPFSTTAYIGSPFMVHIHSDIRFDENLSLKEDYDFTLQNLNKYRIVFRVNKYHYHVRQKEQAGGVAEYRTLEREREQLLLLQKKWGSRIIKEDKLKSGKGRKSKKNRLYDINPIMHSPISGV